VPLVDQPGFQELMHHGDATDDRHRLVSGDGRSLRNR